MQLGIRNIILIVGSTLCFARYSFPQIICNCFVPPAQATTSIGNLTIHHILHYGVIIWPSSSGIICANPDIGSVFPHVGLGGLLVAPCDPYLYELQFDKPILSITIILHTGGGGLPSTIDGGSEIHVFEPSNKITNISSTWNCETTIVDNVIYLGNPLVYPGSGEFTINFTEPVCSFTISGNGCNSGSGFAICTNSIQTPPVWVGVEAPTEVCGQDSVLFTAYGGVAPYTFSYNINGGATQQVTSNTATINVPLPTAGGTYTYELLSITDGTGTSINTTCNNTSTVQVQPMPVAQFTPNPNSGFSPLTVTLNNQSTNATQYQWLLNGAPTTPQNNTLTLQDTGAYQITLVATNALGCTDTALQTVHVLEQLQVVIPNVFTPNNDNVNEWFGITANAAAKATMVILNRWGNVVFEKDFTTTAGGFMELWDGTSTGSVTTPSSVHALSSVHASDGVYFYKLILSGDNWGETFMGSVTLRR